MFHRFQVKKSDFFQSDRHVIMFTFFTPALPAFATDFMLFFRQRVAFFVRSLHLRVLILFQHSLPIDFNPIFQNTGNNILTIKNK
jgi:hypothetical protein